MKLSYFILILSLIAVINPVFADIPDDRYNIVPSDYVSYGYYDYKLNFVQTFPDIRETGTVSSASYVDDLPYEAIKTFRFPFFGHVYSTVYINPNGFFSMVPYDCSRLGFCNYFTNKYIKYIAPLMTDFNPAMSNVSQVHYQIFDQEDVARLVVQWTRVGLYNDANFFDDINSFTFQAEVRANGHIFLRYKRAPFNPEDYTLDNTTYYPVTVGIQDSTTVRTTRLYTPINYPGYSFSFGNWSATNAEIQLFPRATCLQRANCADCTAKNQGVKGNGDGLICGWCAQKSLCADAVGRSTAELSEGCNLMVDANGDASCTASSNAGSSSTSRDVVLGVGLGVGLTGGLAVLGLVAYGCWRTCSRQAQLRGSGPSYEQTVSETENHTGGAAVAAGPAGSAGAASSAGAAAAAPAQGMHRLEDEDEEDEDDVEPNTTGGNTGSSSSNQQGRASFAPLEQEAAPRDGARAIEVHDIPLE